MRFDELAKHDELVLKALYEAGWKPGRKCTEWAASQKTELERRGFEVYPEVVDILEEFGNLTIGKVDSGLETATTFINVDPSEALKDAELFLEYRDDANTILCPLAAVCDRHYLGLNEDGHVFYIGLWIWHVGDNFDEALDALIIGKKCPEVNEDGSWL